MDVYWGKIGAERDSIRFSAFVAFFPHLVAGPIQRAEEFLPQVRPARRSPWGSQVWRGVTRILLGCFKKLAVADPFSALVNYGVMHAGDASSLPSAMVFYLFPLQLYMDFAALTDIAIGVGLLFGIESPENFDRPFTAPNISEFWRRWHMSLTGWLRDYVFMPVRMLLRGWGNVRFGPKLDDQHGTHRHLAWISDEFPRLRADPLGLPDRGRALVVDSETVLQEAPGCGQDRWDYRSGIHVSPGGGRRHIFSRADVCRGRSAARRSGRGHRKPGRCSRCPRRRRPITMRGSHCRLPRLPFAAIRCEGDGCRLGPRLWPRWARWSAYAATMTLSLFLVLLLLAHGQETNPFLYERF